MDVHPNSNPNPSPLPAALSPKPLDTNMNPNSSPLPAALSPKPLDTNMDPNENPYPTTFVQADISSFRQVVQLLTGPTQTVSAASKPATTTGATAPKKTPFKPAQQLYKRRAHTKNLGIIRPVNVIPVNVVANQKKLQSELDERMESESFQRSSSVGDSPVYGRENKKNSIIEFLLADDFNRNNLTVVCIVGESGIGKTSIVQLIYSEERILDYFDARMLITMPEKSDETRLIKKLIESVTSSPCPMTEADLLEELLIDELSGTKVFVVLDDADNENPCFWNKIVTILNHSTRGSVLLVTTKSKDVAEVIGAMQTFNLDPLSDYYCWKIFWQHIFTGLNTNANTELVETGKQLVSKCQHNPLCIKVLAGLLVCLKNEKSWVEILKTDLWNMDGFDGDTLPTLRVGYELMPNDLKKCLHYCSLFPKDYSFAKQQIVRMWMSQGFIISMEGRQPEEVGLQYFDELLLRGFFQHSPIHDVEEDKFIMHDLIRALATNLSRKKGPPDEDALERIFENCFHFSLNPSKIQMGEMKPLINSDLQSFLALTRFSLQTRINMSILDITSLSDLFTKCINIRTLDLSCTDIVELPSSVGMLKQLRYLGVNNTKIGSIPRELYSLVSLQTLEAKDCQHLVELPESMTELTNLRHLDVSKKSGFVKMMIGIGQLTNLQSLAVFCVGCEMPYCSIGELKDLNCLSSCLQIAGLENIRYGLDAKDAALHNKVHLNTLWLHWNDNTTCIESAESVRISEEVLKNLKPNPNIGELIIRNYRGNLFPTWMEDPSFSKLVSIILDKCLNCSQFPALGGLSSLRHLSVQKLYHLVRLENTDSQFVSKNTPKFPSLETLNLWEMYDLEELFETSDCDFPCLRTLSISRCPLLKSVPCFSSLLSLSLYCCVKLPYLPDFPSLKSFRIDGFKKMKSLKLPKDLPSLKELEIRNCNELLLVEGLPKIPEKLNVVHCPKFDSFKSWKPCHSKSISTTRTDESMLSHSVSKREREPSDEDTNDKQPKADKQPKGDEVDFFTKRNGTVKRKISGPLDAVDDGYSWRKYGDKKVLNATHHSSQPLYMSYFRCTFKNDKNCQAKKVVQRSDEDPTIFHVTYIGEHICTQPAAQTDITLSLGRQLIMPTQNESDKQVMLDSTNPSFPIKTHESGHDEQSTITSSSGTSFGGAFSSGFGSWGVSDFHSALPNEYGGDVAGVSSFHESESELDE
ncbi:disease resistance protein RGA2-like [Carex rostrata]